MKTTQKILKSTGLTYPLYDEWRNSCFIDWCYTIAEREYMSAMLLIKHDGVLNWYCDMWLVHVERQFLNDYGSDLEHLEPSLVQELLLTYPDEILQMVPTVLIQMVRPKKTKKAAYESK